MDQKRRPAADSQSMSDVNNPYIRLFVAEHQFDDDPYVRALAAELKSKYLKDKMKAALDAAKKSP